MRSFATTIILLGFAATAIAQEPLNKQPAPNIRKDGKTCRVETVCSEPRPVVRRPKPIRRIERPPAPPRETMVPMSQFIEYEKAHPPITVNIQAPPPTVAAPPASPLAPELAEILREQVTATRAQTEALEKQTEVQRAGLTEQNKQLKRAADSAHHQVVIGIIQTGAQLAIGAGVWYGAVDNAGAQPTGGNGASAASQVVQITNNIAGSNASASSNSQGGNATGGNATSSPSQSMSQNQGQGQHQTAAPSQSQSQQQTAPQAPPTN